MTNYKKRKLNWYSSNAINYFQMLWGGQLALRDLFSCADIEKIRHQLSAGRGASLPKMPRRAAGVKASCPLLQSTASNPPWGQPGQPQGSLALEQFCPGAGEDSGHWLWLCMAWVTSSNPQWPGSWRAGGYCNVMFAVSWWSTQNLATQAVIVAGTLRVGHYGCNLPGPQFSFCWGKERAVALSTTKQDKNQWLAGDCPWPWFLRGLATLWYCSHAMLTCSAAWCWKCQLQQLKAV